MQNRYDERVRETLFPTRIVKLFGKVTNAEALLKEKPLQVNLNEPDCTVLENTGKPSVLLGIIVIAEGQCLFLKIRKKKTRHNIISSCNLLQYIFPLEIRQF